MNNGKLTEILTKQIALHKSLLALTDKKKAIIISQNIKELTHVLKDEQTHVAAIEALEKQRMLLMENIAQIEQAITLQPLQSQLIELIESIQRKNELNQQLLTQSLQLINLELDLLTSSQQADSYNYTKAENDVPSLTQASTFQSKA
ncbi:flagellar protein FlgN [Priestia flexa]|uniref:flagellar protein FlgN n=1 Tax=Priestia flexa TaxID=86664 RepID=UPI000C24A0C9|nr:flagellar export chaperone FlgN [Priestia flexa]MEC0665100.1 flagellar protein FlgN [Priestia flexa]MED3824456.1 flagellar protein FlgN [Priestia flexa]